MATLPMRKVGSTDVSAIGYGAAGIGGAGWGPAGTDEERFKILDRLYELGCTNWDTSSVYGDSEALIGKWFKRTGLRDKIFLATKFGLTPQFKVRGDPEFIKSELATSLERLQTNYIDLYYTHRTDGTVPIETTVGTMVEFVKEGKIKYIGLSGASVKTMRRAHAVHPISAIQIQYSPFELDQEGPEGVIPVARELGAAIFAFSPTGRGMVTGRFKSFEDFAENDVLRRTSPKFKAENFPHINALVASLAEIGQAHNGATPAQVTLAWLLTQGDDIIPIPGSKQMKYVEENLGAAQVKLSEAEIKKIRELCDEIEKVTAQDRIYGAAAAAMSWVETPLP